MNIWTRLGISTALLGIFCIVCSEMIQRDGYYDLHRREIAGVLCGVGVVAFLVGRVVNKKRTLAYRQQEQPTEQEAEEHTEATGEPFILFNLAYWGPILLAFGLVVLFIPANMSRVRVEARAPAAPKPKAKPEPACQTNIVKVAVQQTNQVVFPSLKLQGITRRGTKSSALINGRTFFLGDTVGDAKLISIFENSVVFEQEGQMLSVTLPK
jgi:hypothetical protein